jgi:hypothetical protein
MSMREGSDVSGASPPPPRWGDAGRPDTSDADTAVNQRLPERIGYIETLMHKAGSRILRTPSWRPRALKILR